METQFLEKKAIFPVRERCCLTFVHLNVTTECDKPDETIYKGPNRNPISTLEVLRSFLYHLRGCGKHKFLKKEANFQ